MKRKLITFCLLASLVFSGCFGSDNGDGEKNEKTPEGFQAVETSEFKIFIPEGWQTLDPNDLKSETAKNVIAAFRSTVRDPKFTSNIVIINNEIPEGVVLLDYAKALRQKIGDELGSFKEISTEEIDGTLFIYVEGRESDDADLKRFMQLPRITGNKAYTAVGAFLASADIPTVEALLKAVKSFEVK